MIVALLVDDNLHNRDDKGDEIDPKMKTSDISNCDLLSGVEDGAIFHVAYVEGYQDVQQHHRDNYTVEVVVED